MYLNINYFNLEHKSTPRGWR